METEVTTNKVASQIKFTMELLNEKIRQREIKDLLECDVFKLPSVSPDGYRQLPQASAIYFVIEGTSVVYVGQTMGLRSRILLHDHRQYLKTPSVRVTYLLVPNNRKLRLKIEAALILHLNPRLNDQRHKLPRAKSRLAKQFGRQIES